MLHEFLVKDIENIGVLKLTSRGRDFIENPKHIHLKTDIDYSNLGEEEEISRDVVDSKAYDEALFDILKNLRKKVKYYSSLKNVFNVSRSRYLSHYKGEMDRIDATQVYNIEEKLRYFDVKSSQRAPNSNSDDFKSNVAEERAVMSALNSAFESLR